MNSYRRWVAVWLTVEQVIYNRPANELECQRAYLRYLRVTGLEAME